MRAQVLTCLFGALLSGGCSSGSNGMDGGQDQGVPPLDQAGSPTDQAGSPTDQAGGGGQDAAGQDAAGYDAAGHDAAVPDAAGKDSGGGNTDAAGKDSGGGSVDAAGDMTRVPTPTTIRDLNTGIVPDNTLVTVSGVVTSPVSWLTPDGKYCEYETYIAQYDANPTVQDGIVLFYSKNVNGGTDLGNTNLNECRTAGMMLDIYKIQPGHAVQVTGNFEMNSSNRKGIRQIYMYAGNGAMDQGLAAHQPVPVVLTVRDLNTQTKLMAAQGALVQLKTLLVTDQIVGGVGMTVFGFHASDSTSAGDMAGSPDMEMVLGVVGFDVSYLRAANNMYMAPAKGAMLTSVTGILHGDTSVDFMRVWPRTPADIVP